MTTVTDLRQLDTRFWLDEQVTGRPTWQAVQANVQRIKSRQLYRRDRDLLHMCLYGTDPVLGFGVTSYSMADPLGGAPLSVNIVKSVIDTILAKTVKNRPKPMHLTDGGDYALYKRAKKLDKLCEGQFYASKVYKLNQQVVRDALVFGTGHMRVYDAYDKIHAERTFSPEVYVDDAEARFGNPRSLYHVRTIDRMVLIGLFEEFAKEILAAAAARDDRMGTYEVCEDQVEIIDAYHLPSYPDADDGRWVTCIDNCTLQNEDWDEPSFPYASLRYQEPILGWYGEGIARLLVGKQLEINKLLDEIQRAFHLCSSPKVLLERGSKLIKGHFNNDVGNILEFSGAAPALAVAQTVHPEKFQHLLWLIQSSYAEVGVNAMDAHSEKPAGLNSGKAQEVYSDLGAERGVAFAQAYEDYCVEIGDQMIARARKIAERNGGSYVVTYRGKRAIEKLDWKNAGMARDQYEPHAWPVSSLASTPAAKMQQVQDMADRGWITPATAKRLLDFPDLEAEASLDVAAYDTCMEILDGMSEGGAYEPPEPFFDLTLCIRIAVPYYLRERLRKAPEEILDNIRQFIVDCQQMMKPDEPPALPGAGAAPAALPPGPGGPPPGAMPGGAPAGATLQ